ncbi:SMP-30/gluconolactonase/LRE family protein [Pseudoxanthomonas japonensis]
MTSYRFMQATFLLFAVALAGCTHATPAASTEADALYVPRDVIGDGVFSAGIEGPAFGPDGALYAVSFGRDGTIGRVTFDADGKAKATLFTTLPVGSTGNGIRFGADGSMYIADYSGHHVLRIAPGERDATVFAHMPQANQPNDIAISPDGTLYASDPSWADNTGQLWRIDRSGTPHLLESGMGTTNGVDVSPDGKRLYLNESVQRKVWVYDIRADGSIRNKRLLIAFDDHGLDGMRTDVKGNLYIARYGAGVVAVVSPDGRLLREVNLKGQKPTNVAFGGPDGRTVFVTLQDRGAIEAFRAEYPGREAGL